MPILSLETSINAPRERVFDLARNVDRHTETMGHSEQAIAGTTSGYLEEGDTVTWRARHFGIPLQLTVKITEMESSAYFRDEQIDGPFAEMVHEHKFERLSNDRTIMSDTFQFSSPFGPIGNLVDSLILERYMMRLLKLRNDRLKTIAEQG